MSIRVLKESKIPVSKVAKSVGKLTGKTPHINTPWRWATKGVSGVRLESIVVNGERWTSEEAVERFLVASTEAKYKALPSVTKAKRANKLRQNKLNSQAADLGI